MGSAWEGHGKGVGRHVQEKCNCSLGRKAKMFEMERVWKGILKRSECGVVLEALSHGCTTVRTKLVVRDAAMR